MNLGLSMTLPAVAARGGTGSLPAISKLALLGDSLAAATSGNDVSGHKVTFATGYGGYLARRLGQRVELVINTETGDYDFGLNGALASWYLDGDPNENATAMAYLTALLATDADTVVVLLGANDMVDAGGKTGAECAADLIALWDVLIAAGKNVVAVRPLPQRSTVANYLDRKNECVPLLVAGAAARGNRVQLVDADSAFDDNGDDYLDVALSIDTVHPNITGAGRLGIAIADAIESRVGADTFIEIPESGSALWKTRNPYASGTVGAGNGATDWTLSSVVIQGKALIARTDGIEGNWQELTILDDGIGGGSFGPPPTSGYFANFSTSASGNFTTGATLRGVMELEVVSGTLYSLELNINFGTADKTSDSIHNGGLGSISLPLPLTAGGILLTPPWVSTGAAAALLCRVKAWGDCVIRVGRFGVFEV